jgi:hypothetical protein
MVGLQDEMVDSEAVGDSFKFTGLHLGVWNKMALSVSGLYSYHIF